MELGRSPDTDVRNGNILEVKNVGESPDLALFILQSCLKVKYESSDQMGSSVLGRVEHFCKTIRKSDIAQGITRITKKNHTGTCLISWKKLNKNCLHIQMIQELGDRAEHAGAICKLSLINFSGTLGTQWIETFIVACC